MKNGKTMNKKKYQITFLCTFFLAFFILSSQKIYANEIQDETSALAEYHDSETNTDYKLKLTPESYLTTKENKNACNHNYTVLAENIGDTEINGIRFYLDYYYRDDTEVHYYLNDTKLYNTVSATFEDYTLKSGALTEFTISADEISNQCEEMRISKIEINTSEDEPIEIMLSGEVEFTFFSLDRAVKESFNLLKDSLLNPDSLILYNCVAKYARTDDLLDEIYLEDNTNLEDFNDRIEVCLHIGAENRMGGISDDMYGFVYDLNGDLLENVSLTEYNEDDYEPSNDMAGLWLNYSFSEATDSWNGWKQYDISDDKETLYQVNE